MKAATSWRHRVAVPVLAVLGLAGGAAGALVTTATNASGATTVTTESGFRDAWANDADVVLGADINLTCQEGAGDGESEAVRDLAGTGTLDGQGHTITQTCPENRVLQITGATGAVTISNVTITGGQAVFGTHSGNGGGGVQVTASDSDLTIVNTTVTGNDTCEGGGGLEVEQGPFTAINSTISNNRSIEEGGGVVIYESSPMVITNSTITGNTDAENAGGIGAGGGLTIAYSDVVGNTLDPNLSMSQCADAGTKSDGAHAAANGDAANINTYGTDLTAFGTVVTDPTGATNCDLGDSGTTHSKGYNFSDDDSCGFDQSTDNVKDGNDPMLGALADNGGPTKTLLPQTDSPLIDGIPNSACQTDPATDVTADQRGLPRPEQSGGLCDIGAVEVQLPPPPTTTTAPAPTPSPAAVVATPRFTG